jgi:hypothetical protein
MPTTITKHIGLGTGNGYDFSGAAAIQNWIASLNGLDIISADQIQQGVLHFNGTGDGEFTAAGSVADFAAISVTCSATQYVELTTATGQSFRDNAGVRTNPAYYDATKGAGLRNTGSAGYTVRTAGTVPYLRLSNLQIKGDTGSSGAIQWNATGVDLWDSCIIQGTETLVNSGGVPQLNNCILILTDGTSGRLMAHIGTSLIMNFCTLVIPSGVTAAHIIDYGNSANSGTFRNCAFFGSTTDYQYRAGSATVAYTTCASDLAGTTGVTGSLTYASQFVSTTNDFRQLNTSSAFFGTGTAVGGITTDISAFARKTPPDIGAWELAGAVAAAALMGQAVMW